MSKSAKGTLAVVLWVVVLVGGDLLIAHSAVRHVYGARGTFIGVMVGGVGPWLFRRYNAFGLHQRD